MVVWMVGKDHFCDATHCFMDFISGHRFRHPFKKPSMRGFFCARWQRDTSPEAPSVATLILHGIFVAHLKQGFAPRTQLDRVKHHGYTAVPLTELHADFSGDHRPYFVHVDFRPCRLPFPYRRESH